MNWLDSKLRRYAWWRKWRGLPEPMSVRMSEVTREALRILHQKLGFVDALNREYAEPFPETIPDTIRIRKPSQYTGKA